LSKGRKAISNFVLSFVEGQLAFGQKNFISKLSDEPFLDLP
jgi:hypothetical protein